MAHNGRQNSKVPIAKRETFPRTGHLQRTSSGQAIDQQRLSSTLSFPKTVYSSYTSSLRPSMGNSDAVAPLETPRSDKSQCTSFNAGTSQREIVQIHVEEPSRPSEANGVAGTRTLHEYHARCSLLLRAALKGDWPTAEPLIKEHRDLVRAPITEDETTALHIATIAKHTTFVKEVLKLMTPVDLELKNRRGSTALHFATQTGIVRIAKEMVKKNNKLPSIPDDQEETPLHIAAFLGHRNMVDYLFSVTSLPPLTTYQRSQLLLATISAGFYDKALEILNNDSELLTAEPGCGMKALQELASKPSAIGSKRQLSFWQRYCLKYFGFKKHYEIALMKTLARQLVEALWKEVGILADKRFSSTLVDEDMTSLLIEATKVGNVEFLIIILRTNPELIWKEDKDYGSLFHVAISYRQEGVYNLIHEIGAIKDTIATYIVKDNNNMLHLAGQLAPSDRLSNGSTAPIQMQKELLWFMEIEKIVPPSYVNMKNSSGHTPRDVFRMKHEDLQKNGEKWIKKTVNYCMLVAILVATMACAAPFTGLGDSDQTGPGYSDQGYSDENICISCGILSLVFLASDAVALFFSSTSILIFLSILTSTYVEEDFLKSIPLRMLRGLVSLFVSIAGMIISFSATCISNFSRTMGWGPNIITILAFVPIVLFVMHLQLWVDTIKSAMSKILFRPHKRRLF